jgi:ATP-dependent protease ClpP protease subunit
MTLIPLIIEQDGKTERTYDIQILTKHTKQPKKKIQIDIERDFIMTQAQAKNYGIIEAIIENRDQSKK